MAQVRSNCQKFKVNSSNFFRLFGVTTGICLTSAYVTALPFSLIYNFDIIQNETNIEFDKSINPCYQFQENFFSKNKFIKNMNEKMKRKIKRKIPSENE